MEADEMPVADIGDLDPRTPVLVGVGQVSERLGQPGYRRRSPVDLAADAARAALADSGADPAVIAAAIDTVAGVRQFEISHPAARSPLGRSHNYPRSVVGRVGAVPGRAILERSGGQAPQHPLNQLPPPLPSRPPAPHPSSPPPAPMRHPESNRASADTTTRYIGAREKVNQGAVVLMMPVAAAQRLGVPRGRWVFLHGHAALAERRLLDRADLSASPAAVMAARHALEVAGIGAGDLATIDLYSCFPAPVFNICDRLGLSPDHPRRLTLTRRPPILRR